VVNGQLYVAGGTNNSGSLNNLEWYNPAANSWIDQAPMPTTRTRPGAGAVNGILYVLGGQNGTTYNTVEAYNPTTNTWSTVAPMPTARAGLSVAVINGILYAIGGEFIGGTMNNLEAYNPATNSWTVLASMPTARAGMAVGVMNGILYVAGGISSTGQGFSPLSTLESYNPTTNSWTTGLPGMPTPRGFCVGGVMDGQLYAAGGETNTGLGVLNNVESYNPSTNSWSTQASLPTAVNGAAAGVINGNLFVVGGSDVSNNPLTLNQDGALVCGFSPTPTFTVTNTPTATLTPTQTPTPTSANPCDGVAAWSGNSVAYSVGSLVTYPVSGVNHLYKCIQAHTSQAGWMPPAVPALWQDLGPCPAGNTPTFTPTNTPTKTATPTFTPSPTPTPTPMGLTVAISGVSPSCGGPGTPVAITITWSGNSTDGSLDAVLGFASSTTPSCAVSWTGSESCSGNSILGPTNIGNTPSGTYVWHTTVPAKAPSGDILVGLELNCGSVGTGPTGNCGTDYWMSSPFSTTCGNGHAAFRK